MIWEKDSKRISILENRGYRVLIIWEYDFKKAKEETVKKCIEFLKEEN
jgi:G:T-mismatch repair DNA endonuclease (very short patch repair protein)